MSAPRIDPFVVTGGAVVILIAVVIVVAACLLWQRRLDRLDAPPVEPERLVAERSVREGWALAGEGADRIWRDERWAA